MKTDTKYNHVPGWFEYISQLGASLLVDATGKLFRDYDYIRRLQCQPKQRRHQAKTSIRRLHNELADESEDDEVVAPHVRAEHFKQEAVARYKQNQETLEVMAQSQPLLTLEYLVSNLSIFDVTNPHDSIYALLGIAKDTTPTAANKELRVTDHTQSVLEMFTAKKQYKVDYKASYIDICKEFIEFCVRRNVNRDPSRALDVICRPFAIDVEQKPPELPLPSWIPRLSKASYGMDRGPGIDGLRMGRKNADSLVGLPNLTHRNYNAAETKSLDKKVFRFRKRVSVEESGKAVDAGRSDQPLTSQLVFSINQQDNKTQDEASGVALSANSQVNGRSESGPPIPLAMAQTKGTENVALGQELSSFAESNAAESSHRRSTSFSITKVVDAQTINAPNTGGKTAISTTTGSPETFRDVKTTSRSSKSASQSSEQNLNHFSLFVKGFVLDTIAELQASSQSGSIPTVWAHFAGWGEMQATPPEHFWRTLVADRGSDGKNPPVYYSRACQESFRKGNTTSGVVDTTGLIEHERNSVVAQFCRRVQAVIWNRALMKTEAGRLGLVAANVKENDLVCILYGCSVPVILRRHGPKEPHVRKNEMNWELKFLANYVGESYKNRLHRQKLFREKREKDKKTYQSWELKKREQWKKDEIWTREWELVRMGLIRVHEFKAWIMKKVENLESAKDSNAAKMTIESMHSYVHVLVPRIYEIAAWASEKGDSDENVMDQIRFSSDDPMFHESFRMTDYQKELWDEFRNDSKWREWWQNMDKEYREAEGFHVWSRFHKKPTVYFDDREKAKMEWVKQPAQSWTTEWTASNSWFLCLDSYRAWLRERGKFYGPEEVVNNKQMWETDDEWRQTRNKDEPDAKSFSAWMNEKGLENPDVQEGRIKDQRMRFEEWRRRWLSENSEATVPDTWEAEKSQWVKIEQEQKNEEDEKRRKKAQKQETEPFLERWRKGWKPEVVNWEEFEIALCYGRRWLKLVKSRKRDHLKEQGKNWSKLQSVKARQAIRIEHLKRKKGARANLYTHCATETTALDKTDEEAGSESSNSIINEQAGSEFMSNQSQKNSSGHSAGSIESNNEASKDEAGGTFTHSKSQIVSGSNLNNSASVEPTKLTDSSTEDLSQVFDDQNNIDRHSKDKPTAPRTSSLSFTEHNMTERPTLKSSHTQLKHSNDLHNELEKDSMIQFASKQMLLDWIERKKEELPTLWHNTQTSINQQLASWERRTPVYIGKDGKFYRDFRPPSKGEKELREKQKLEKGKETDHEGEDDTDHEGNPRTVKEKDDAKLEGKGDEKDKMEGVEKAILNLMGEEMGAGNDIEKKTRKDYGGIRQRQRLTTKEKSEYMQMITDKFESKIGEDGQWYYEMMGECYVHGMMDGEGMAYQNNEGISTTVFEIR